MLGGKQRCIRANWNVLWVSQVTSHGIESHCRWTNQSSIASCIIATGSASGRSGCHGQSFKVRTLRPVNSLVRRPASTEVRPWHNSQGLAKCFWSTGPSNMRASSVVTGYGPFPPATSVVSGRASDVMVSMWPVFLTKAKTAFQGEVGDPGGCCRSRYLLRCSDPLLSIYGHPLTRTGGRPYRVCVAVAAKCRHIVAVYGLARWMWHRALELLPVEVKKAASDHLIQVIGNAPFRTGYMRGIRRTPPSW